MLRRRLTNVFQTFLLIIVEEIHSKKHFELYFAKFDQPRRTISVLKCKKKKKKMLHDYYEFNSDLFPLHAIRRFIY